MSFRQPKPETVERHRREDREREQSRREAFLANYASIRERYQLPEPPATGASYQTDLADGRAVIVTPNGISVF